VGIIVAALVAVVYAGWALAAGGYPDRTVKLIVPYGAGGSTDVVSRIVAQALTTRLQNSFVVENRPGANGIVGTSVVAQSAPDGYTILMASNGQAVNVSLYPNQPYELSNDFAPMVEIAGMPNVLAVNPSMPIKSVKDVVDLAKAKPGELTYAHAGIGSSQNISGEMLNMMAGIKLRGVPYKGGGPAVMDALAGNVPLVFAGLPAIVQQIKNNQLRPLAVTGPKRSPQLPDVPTMIEAGYPNYNEVFWVGMVAPRGTPNDVVKLINGEMNKILTDPDVVNLLAAQGAEVAAGTPEQLAAFIKSEIAKDASIIKAANITPE
jgi:tripartite-type tricarboxylate transporter receptor subunit TctC